MFLQQIVLTLSCGWPVYLIEPSKWFYQILEKSTNLTILGYESYTWVYKTSITGYIRTVWIYQRGNHNNKDRVTRTPLKQGVNSGAPDG